MNNKRKKVAIIGGGWSGLYALKYSLEADFEATLFEQKDHIGGVWQYQEDVPGGVWESAHATSSKTYLHASDYPMPEKFPLFPHHSDILAYLHDYVNNFNLRPHIQLKHQVQSVDRKGEKWIICITNLENNETRIHQFDAVFICIGQTSNPNFPTDTMYQNFAGETMHSHSYKYPTPSMQGKNILVIGGGESAGDIANEVSHVAKHVYMSIRHGQWFVERHNGAYLAADIRFSRRTRWFVTNYGNNLVVRLFEWLWGVSFGAGGHGINIWQPEVPLLNGFINKSRRVIEKITFGMVTPKSAITAIDGKKVLFKHDDAPTDIDMIIYATGYKKKFPFAINPAPTTLYKYIFYPDQPTMAVIGHVRPVFGSIVGLAELQARWATAVLAEKATLPSASKMHQIIEKDRLRHKKTFPADHESRPHLVSHFEYADYILKELKADQSFFRLFFTNYEKWKLLLKAPWTPFEVLANEPNHEQTALEKIQSVYSERKSIKGPSLLKLMLYIIIVSTMMMITVLFLSTYSLWLVVS